MTLKFLTAFLCAFASSAQTLDRQFQVPGSPSPIQMQEIATVIRTVFDIQDLSMDARTGTLHVSGAAPLVNGVEWLLHELEQPEEIRLRAPHEYTLLANDRLPMVRAVYVQQAESAQYVQELLTVLRTVIRIQKVFNYHQPDMIVMRGSKADLDLAAWIISEIEAGSSNATGANAAHQFTGRTDGTITRVFFTPQLSIEQIQTALKTLRTDNHLMFIYPVPVRKAFVVRGTPDEIAAAERLLNKS